LYYLYTKHWWREVEAGTVATEGEGISGRLRHRVRHLLRELARHFRLHGRSFDLAALELADTTGRRVAITTEVKRIIERPLLERDAPHDYRFYRGTFYGLENAGVYSAAKAACILAAIRLSRSRVSPGTQPWHHVDVGSGAGFVPLELLLNRDAGISTVTIVQPFDGYLDLFCDAYLFLRDALGRGVYYSRSTAEDFDFPKRTGSVSFCGSLLLTDRKRVTDVLRRAWDALAPGGTLAIWEHVPAKGEVRTWGADDPRFELEELEILLSALGKVDRWNPSTLALCGPGEHVSGAVFMSLTKPA
jgi:SAM-dependent methyltransferase